MNERKTAMLKAIAQSPRTLHGFTHGDAPCAPHVITTYLEALVDDGLVELDGDLYCITDAGRAVLNQPQNITPSRILTNACSTEPLVQKPWNIRAGSDAFLSIRSRGMGV